MRGTKSGETGFETFRTIFSDRAYAFVEISFYDDVTWDIEKSADFLCEKCLNQLVEDTCGTAYGLGIIDPNTNSITVFQENYTGFVAGDFYVHCDFSERDKKSDTEKLKILTFYCPLRRGDKTR